MFKHTAASGRNPLRGQEPLNAAYKFLPHILGLALRAYLAHAFVTLEFHRPADWPDLAIFFERHYGMWPWLFKWITELAGAMNIVFSLCLLLGTGPVVACVALLLINCVPLLFSSWLWTLPQISILQTGLFWSSYLLALIACGTGKLSLPALLQRRTREGQ